jgi:PAS domain S-box-containing protein
MFSRVITILCGVPSFKGYTGEEVMGRDLVQEFISPDYRVQVKEVLDNALKGQQTANFEFPLFTKNHQRVEILLNATTRRDGGAYTLTTLFPF